jgi:hypothetical protein
VLLQRPKRSGWKTVDRDRLDRRSDFVLDAPRCGARYRVVWPKQGPENLSGKTTFRL